MLIQLSMLVKFLVPDALWCHCFYSRSGMGHCSHPPDPHWHHLPCFTYGGVVWCPGPRWPPFFLLRESFLRSSS